MEIREYANLLRKLGSKVIETKSCIWHEIKPFYFSSFPLHKVYNPTQKEIMHVLLRRSWLGLQYCSNNTHMNSSITMMVCSDTSYGLSSLKCEIRNQVRRGLRRCELKKIPFSFLKEKAIKINKSALERQQWPGDHSVYIDEAKWIQTMSVYEEYEDLGMEAYGSLLGDILAGYIIVIFIEDWCYIINFMSHSDYLKNFPNNALLFWFLENTFSMNRASHVVLGLKPPLCQYS